MLISSDPQLALISSCSIIGLEHPSLFYRPELPTLQVQADHTAALPIHKHLYRQHGLL